MEFLLALVSGFTLGCVHAFDADHIAAVTAFASKHPDARKAARFGLIWGLGHTTTLVVFGGISAALKFVIPPLVETLAEGLVGLLLVGIGVWVLQDLLRRKHIHIHAHTHDGVEHVHFHSHEEGAHHRHEHSMFLVGAAHGFAGTAAVMVIIPLTLSQSLVTALVFLLLFGAGTIAAMGTFAYLVGSLSKLNGAKRFLTAFRGVAGAASLGLGLLWIGAAVVR